ncbi:hypothetical protein LZK98_11435 [Sphingomonas cannabina]|uniref:hypothetical protein n=1 Tax=Sphingomonas cannabina TaxID=2899123 RepID=UPI001F2DD04C|nr:hypothetical protein [Sphingomonas cannabina]UIJ43702.1 hypothetical protein LZK98_11435 [Sphingomonas cannabina]
MTPRENSVQSEPIVSDTKVRDALRRELDRAINIERTFTRAQLALESGVNVYTIDAILSRDPAKQRRVALADALSIASVLGERAVSAVLSLIGYVARPVDEPDDLEPARIVADGLAEFAVIASAAADGRIDHIERPKCRDAADHIIATVLPLSSHGRLD